MAFQVKRVDIPFPYGFLVPRFFADENGFSMAWLAFMSYQYGSFQCIQIISFARHFILKNPVRRLAKKNAAFKLFDFPREFEDFPRVQLTAMQFAFLANAYFKLQALGDHSCQKHVSHIPLRGMICAASRP
jgi:hypothetical protein